MLLAGGPVVCFCLCEKELQRKKEEAHDYIAAAEQAGDEEIVEIAPFDEEGDPLGDLQSDEGAAGARISSHEGEAESEAILDVAGHVAGAAAQGANFEWPVAYADLCITGCVCVHVHVQTYIHTVHTYIHTHTHINIYILLQSQPNRARNKESSWQKKQSAPT